MFYKFYVTKTSPDQLSQQFWMFSLLDDIHAVLDGYTEESRPSKRHKFKVDKAYVRLDKRKSTLELANVPFPDEVIADVRQQIIDNIRVTKTLDSRD